MVEGLPKTYTVDEVAKVLRVNPRTVTRMIERGELRGVKAGRLWRVPEGALQDYLKGQPGYQQSLIEE